MKKKISIILIFLTILYIPSIIKFMHMEYSLNKMNSTKDNLKTTDLSNIKVEGYRIGDQVQELDFRDKYPNDLYFNTKKYTRDTTSDNEVSYLGDFYIKKGEIVKINVDLTIYDVQVNSKKVTTVGEMVKILGNNYSTNFEKLSSYYDTYTFIDYKNDLEIHVADIYNDKSKPYIVLKRIDRNYSDKYTTINLLPLNNDYFGYVCTLFLIASYPLLLLSSDTYINPLSLIYMPLIYFIIFIPTMLALFFKKHRIINIVLQILIILMLFFVVPFIFFSAQ